MLKVMLFTLAVLLLAMVCTEAKRKPKSEGRPKEAKDCTEWQFEDCTLQGEAKCGKGTKKGARTGDNCPVKEKSFPCRVPCAKNKCKYQKGDWSECNLELNTMNRTNTLKKGDPALCQASKVITKKCKKTGGGRQKQNNRRRTGGSTGGSE